VKLLLTFQTLVAATAYDQKEVSMYTAKNNRQIGHVQIANNSLPPRFCWNVGMGELGRFFQACLVILVLSGGSNLFGQVQWPCGTKFKVANGNWDDPDYWTNGVPGKNSSACLAGFKDKKGEHTSTVFIQGASDSTDNLLLLGGNTLELRPSRKSDTILQVVGENIYNAGEITLQGPPKEPLVSKVTQLLINGSKEISNGKGIVLDGGGSVVLTGTAQIIGQGQKQFLDNVNNTITGSGTIFINLINEVGGVVDANQSGGVLSLLPLSKGQIKNQGRFQATGGGTLELGGQINNADGRIRATNGSTVMLGLFTSVGSKNGEKYPLAATIVGGTLSTAGDGKISVGEPGAVLSGGATNQGLLIVSKVRGTTKPQLTVRGIVTNSGTLVNHGNVAVGPLSLFNSTGSFGNDGNVVVGNLSLFNSTGSLVNAGSVSLSARSITRLAGATENSLGVITANPFSTL
jgi:hypothetical protein